MIIQRRRIISNISSVIYYVLVTMDTVSKITKKNWIPIYPDIGNKWIIFVDVV